MKPPKTPSKTHILDTSAPLHVLASKAAYCNRKLKRKHPHFSKERPKHPVEKELIKIKNSCFVVAARTKELSVINSLQPVGECDCSWLINKRQQQEKWSQRPTEVAFRVARELADLATVVSAFPSFCHKIIYISTEWGAVTSSTF